MFRSIISKSAAFINLAILVGIGLVLSGCGMLHKADAPAMPAVPFDAMVIRHTVADFAKWKPAFDADAPARDAAGLHLIGVGRGILNPNEVDLPFVADSVEKAKAFGGDPRLKDVMKKAGVTSEPNVKFLRVIRMSEVGKQGALGNYVTLAHKVKDFDAWLKVFDREGAAVRAKDGLIDAVLARGIDDPNLVFLVFKINSVEQVKAAMANPERQKLMQEGNVVGEPEIYFGNDK